MAGKRPPKGGSRVVAENRRARRDYEILETLEAGLVLAASEVTSLLEGGAAVAESYVSFEGREAFLINAHIPAYGKASSFGHLERRPRKLLLRRRELDRLFDSVQKQGFTAVPLRIYFTERGIAKLLIGAARGKKLHDKRETEKQRDWQRQKARLLRAR